jgi:protein-disulfide isomerase
MGLGQYAPALTEGISGRDHVLGPWDAPAQLLEYGDYECLFCETAYPHVNAVLDRLGERLLFAFRHFPVPGVHPFSALAAEAAEAASAQGQFWAMHDMLFQNQDALELEDLRDYAQAIGLDLERFDDDLATHRYQTHVSEDFRSGIRSGVNGTPTFFVNGVRHNGGHDLDSLLEALAPTAGVVQPW